MHSRVLKTESEAGWATGKWSQGGKEILLKSVVQDIPTYTMSIFMLPKGLFRYINSLNAKVLVGQPKEKKRGEDSLGEVGKNGSFQMSRGILNEKLEN
jgi:hypothetical protein